MDPKPIIVTLTGSTMVNREILYSTGSETRNSSMVANRT